MLLTNTFDEGDMVDFEFASIKGHGRVCGVATVCLPVIGSTYIVEDHSGQFPNETYPYSHLAIPEFILKLRP